MRRVVRANVSASRREHDELVRARRRAQREKVKRIKAQRRVRSRVRRNRPAPDDALDALRREVVSEHSQDRDVAD